MGQQPVRVGVIGRGYGQRAVAVAFSEVDGCEVVDVVSPRDDAAVAALCKRHDVDLISVHSPPFLHLDNVRRAIEAGHAVLCDKPFGRNIDDARQMVHLAEEAGVVNLVNFENRFDPARTKLRDLVRLGAAGRPDHVRCTHVMNISRVPLRPYGWLFDAELGGGWLRSIGSHQIDFVRWTFGEVVDGSAELRTAIAERPDAEGNLHACTADDGFTAVLRMASGVTALIDSTFSAAANLPPSLLVIGDEAVLELVAEQRIVRHTQDGSEEVFSYEIGGDFQRQLVGNMRTYAELICEAVRSGVPGTDAPTFADGLACVEVMDRLVSKAGLYRPVDIE